MNIIPTHINKIKVLSLSLVLLAFTSAFAGYEIKSFTLNNETSKIMKAEGYEMQPSIGQIESIGSGINMVSAFDFEFTA